MKTTIVVLGGLWYSPRLYQEMSEYFRHAGLEVSVPDLTGKDLFDRVGAAYGAIRKLGEETRLVMVAHSFGAIVGHKLIELHPELEERVTCFVGLGAVSPYGIERLVSARLALTYPARLLRELFGEMFSIPDFGAFQEEFGGTSPREFQCLVPEPARLLRSLMFRGLLGGAYYAPMASSRFSCPVHFFNGSYDQVVTQRSLDHWERHYNSHRFRVPDRADERFCSVQGATHHSLIVNQYVFHTLWQVVGRHML
ncbi:MAG: alpha/beta hydrolase [Parcubacteria group bacterium]|nr:alpha/beta hydrolase [Parcubacteria group bacterium]